MVAALNCWWPDGQVFRSTDGGKTWNALWAWQGYPTMDRYYAYDDSLAPWIGPTGTANSIVTQIGWMMEALVIDPFDSNHWLYGTGETIYGGHDLLNWDNKRNVTLKSLADGIEETSIQGLIFFARASSSISMHSFLLPILLPPMRQPFSTNLKAWTRGSGSSVSGSPTVTNLPCT